MVVSAVSFPSVVYPVLVVLGFSTCQNVVPKVDKIKRIYQFISMDQCIVKVFLIHTSGITYESISSCNSLLDFLVGRLKKQSPYIKYKVI